MDLRLNGKRALVTGSSAGIGEAIVRELAREGATVVVHGREVSRTQAVAASLLEGGARAFADTGDITDDEEAEAIAGAARKAAGGIDILINNAGAYPMAGWFESTTKQWLDSFNLDVLAGVIQHLVPSMRQAGWGRVIQLSSASAVRVPSNFFPVYATCKAAQSYIAKSLAAELARSGVTVNVVSPGVISTETNKRLLREEAERDGRPTDWASVEQHYVDTMMVDPIIPRIAGPEEIAPLVAYLASPLADHVTGADFVIDGGYQVGGFRRQETAPTPSTGRKPVPVATLHIARNRTMSVRPSLKVIEDSRSPRMTRSRNKS